MSEQAMFGRRQLLAQDTCNKCGAPIQWALYLKTNKSAPLDVEPSPVGRLHLDVFAMTYVYISKEEAEAAVADGAKLFVNHHATCKVERAERFERVTDRPAARPFQPRAEVVDIRTRRMMKR